MTAIFVTLKLLFLPLLEPLLFILLFCALSYLLLAFIRYRQIEALSKITWGIKTAAENDRDHSLFNYGFHGVSPEKQRMSAEQLRIMAIAYKPPTLNGDDDMSYIDDCIAARESMTEEEIKQAHEQSLRNDRICFMREYVVAWRTCGMDDVILVKDAVEVSGGLFDAIQSANEPTAK